jgi:hypothetical protein
VAIQQGQYAGRRIAQTLLGKPSSTPSGISIQGIWPLLERDSRSFRHVESG